MNSLSTASRVKATPDQVSSELGNEVVILHVKNGVYYGLDEVGVVIWKRLQQGTSVKELVDAVTAEFDVDPNRCEEDILRILEEMRAAHLIVVDAA